MAGEDEVKLLGSWASPYVARVKMALHLRGVPYEYVEEDFADKSDLLLHSNPVHKAVPVLIHAGKPVCESRVIVEYVDEAFPLAAGAPLLPADPRELAAARFWAAFVDDELLAPWGMVMRSATDEERAEWTRRTVAAVQTLEGRLRECCGGKGFFGGDGGVGYVDVLLGGMVPWVRATEKLSGHNFFDAGKAPLLAAWMERFGDLDAAKAVFQDVDSLVEYAGTIRARLSAEAASNC